MTTGVFQSDLETIRRRAREKMHKGAVTGAYLADRAKVVDVLNDVPAAEVGCVLHYKNHYYMAQGTNHEEQGQADMVSERITQLGGEPDLNPAGLATRNQSEYCGGDALTELIKEDLVAERIAIETYAEVIRWLGDDDPATRRIMEDIILAQEEEEEHAGDLLDLLGRIGAP
jgi:bacterioferritin